MKTRLTNIKVYTNDKDGKPLRTKDGKPYTRMNIQIESHGDKWISGFGNARNKSWQIGDEVDVEVKENGQYLNFEMPKPAGMNPEALNEIRVGISMLNQRLDRIERLLSTPKEPEISPSDVPF